MFYKVSYVILVIAAIMVVYMQYKNVQFDRTAKCKEFGYRTLNNVPVRCLPFYQQH